MRSSRWFFTWRTYASWLPGESGFVGHYRDDGRRTIDHAHGQPATPAIPALERYARGQLRDQPVTLTRPQADALLAQFHETAAFRGHTLDAVAVVTTHVHLVFATSGQPDPGRTLADWKAYATRALNKHAAAHGTGSVSDRVGDSHPVAHAPGSTATGKAKGKRWWAEDGSKPQLFDDDAYAQAVRYVRDQQPALVVWLSPAAALMEPGA